MMAFRADAKHIVTGHFMRCLMVAQELRKRGADGIFVLVEETATALITECGFSYVLLNSQWDDLEGELPVMRRFLRETDL